MEVSHQELPMSKMGRTDPSDILKEITAFIMMVGGKSGLAFPDRRDLGPTERLHKAAKSIMLRSPDVINVNVEHLGSTAAADGHSSTEVATYRVTIWSTTSKHARGAKVPIIWMDAAVRLRKPPDGGECEVIVVPDEPGRLLASDKTQSVAMTFEHEIVSALVAAAFERHQRLTGNRRIELEPHCTTDTHIDQQTLIGRYG